MSEYKESKKHIDAEYEIIMSPILSNKFQELTQKLSNIEDYLKENRKIYRETLTKISNIEEKNKNEIEPIIRKMKINSDILETNNGSPFEQSRIYNRIMRKRTLPHINVSNSSSIIPGLLGVPFVNTSSYNKNTSTSSSINHELEISNLDINDEGEYNSDISDI